MFVKNVESLFNLSVNKILFLVASKWIFIIVKYAIIVNKMRVFISVDVLWHVIYEIYLVLTVVILTLFF